MRYLLVIFFASAFAFATNEADAFGRRRRSRPSQHRVAAAPSYDYAGGPQAVAEQKASFNARRGNFWHPGGSFGGANYEGVGFSTYSAQDALNNCCYTGQRTVAGQSVVRGANGWYAVKLFY